MFVRDSKASQLFAVFNCHALQSFIDAAPQTKLNAANATVFVVVPDTAV
jgi:hypothetical protein